jgi:plasmid stabilization system protein ParE
MQQTGCPTLLTETPAAGSQRSFRRIAGIRSRPIKGFENYLIFDREKRNKVEIVRVLHGMRNLPQFFRP